MNRQGLGSPNHKLPPGSVRSYVRFAALDVSFCNAAVPGATAAQVRTHQLAIALEHRPHLASLVVGINDVLRADWDAQEFRGDLLFCADRLSEQGAVLATVRFHDHGRVFGLPRPVRGFLTRRIDEGDREDATGRNGADFPPLDGMRPGE